MGYRVTLEMYGGGGVIYDDDVTESTLTVQISDQRLSKTHIHWLQRLFITHCIACVCQLMQLLECPIL